MTMKPTLLAGLLALTTSLAAAPAFATQSGTPAAQASGDSAAASVEVTATLGSQAVLIPASATVMIIGTGTTLVTGDPQFIDDAAIYAEDMLASGFGDKPLEISDETIVYDEMPSVPYEPES